ncbi:hypothetical protein ACROYT_G004534 [Oculina patagonica]
MTYFNPAKPIVVRVEASYHEGLSAGLFQETGSGLQPVHFISRTMTDTEKRYSQTEKDALSVHWAKNRFSIYLLGAPKLKIITAHKPLLPLFNKATMRLPPRIEKWVMRMQDVDFEQIYEPGKDDRCRSTRLPIKTPTVRERKDAVERVIKYVVTAEHAVVIDQIKEETRKDIQLQKLSVRILTGDWEQHKKDPDITPFYSVHSQCYECQVTTKQHRQEPVKVTDIPKKPWDVIAVDFSGPYPDGHYNLVAIDKRTRYPEVVKTNSTAFQPTKEKLKTMFATHGTPRQLESDNGPPFNSREFAEFAKTE